MLHRWSFQRTYGKAKHFTASPYAKTMVSSVPRLIRSIPVLLCIVSPARGLAQTQVTPSPGDQGQILLADAKALFEQAKFTEADRAVRQYLKDHPNSADAHF